MYRSNVIDIINKTITSEVGGIIDDEDGYWQFLCDGNHKEEDARVVSLASILSIDETMSDLSELDYGEYAEAESVTSDWIVRRMDK